MRNPKFQSLIKDEFVKRFESTVQHEIANHNQAIVSYRREMADLNISVSNLDQKLKNIFDHIDACLKTLRDSVLQDAQKQSEKIDDFGDKLENISITSEALRQSLQRSSTVFSTKDYVESVKDDFHRQVFLLHRTFQDKLEESHQEIKNILSKEIFRLSEAHTKEVKRIDDKLDEQMESLRAFKVDSETILKEIRVYKKDTLIIEKKIENLYTLIDRLKSGGKKCPKPD